MYHAACTKLSFNHSWQSVVLTADVFQLFFWLFIKYTRYTSIGCSALPAAAWYVGHARSTFFLVKDIEEIGRRTTSSTSTSSTSARGQPTGRSVGALNIQNSKFKFIPFRFFLLFSCSLFLEPLLELTVSWSTRYGTRRTRRTRSTTPSYGTIIGTRETTRRPIWRAIYTEHWSSPEPKRCLDGS